MEAPRKTPMQNAQALSAERSKRKRLEAICFEAIGAPYPRNRRERRRVLHAMRKAAA